MSRLAYLLRLLDARDRLMLAGLLGVVLMTTAGLAYVHGRHLERQVKVRACEEHQERVEAGWRARGLVAVRLSDPCWEPNDRMRRGQ